MDLIIWAVWAVGFFVSWRTVFCVLWTKEKAKKRYRGLDGEDRAFSAAVAGALSLMWPTMVIAYPAWKWVTSPTPAEKRDIKRQEAEEEAARLRKIIEDLGIDAWESQA